VHRRVFLGTLAGGLLAAPFAAGAQQVGEVHRIGFLSPSSPSDPERPASPFGEGGLAAFRQGMRDLGYAEGRNITIEPRWAEGRFERLPDLAAELVRLKVGVIVSMVTRATLAAKHATRTTPILMVAAGDPLGSGLVAKLAPPGATPADLPVEQPTKFDPVINLKTAKALGLTIPPVLLQRADQVIE
jgi:putative tryptophan/tyrosine transport system substrate-binding protein